MPMKAYRILPLLAPLALALGASPAASAQATRSADLSLGDAVSRAQQETNGQVLSAESRHFDRRTEYRIKVLTPQGHVRVLNIPASGGDNARPALPSPRNPPGRRAGGKERH
jgi:hypothetical protein